MNNSIFIQKGTLNVLMTHTFIGIILFRNSIYILVKPKFFYFQLLHLLNYFQIKYNSSLPKKIPLFFLLLLR